MEILNQIFTTFFGTIGVGVFIYAVFYIIILCFIDSDIQLTFYEIFGKSPKKLHGKVTIITGASSGIGEHIAYALAKCGAKLILNARREDELKRVKTNCINVSQGQLKENDILLIEQDITDLSLHESVFDHAVNHFGTVDILINNAGRSQRALFENVEIGVDHQMFDLNVFAVVNLSRIAANYFKNKGSGQILVVSSLAALFGLPYCSTYTATKHAIHGYFNAFRTEQIGKNISITLFCPGPTQTNVLKESFTEKYGQKYGIPAEEANRMSSERCGKLCTVALVNKINEAWVGRFPSMLFIYTVVNFPLTYNWVINLLGPTKFFKPVVPKEQNIFEKPS